MTATPMVVRYPFHIVAVAVVVVDALDVVVVVVVDVFYLSPVGRIPWLTLSPPCCSTTVKQEEEERYS